VLFYQMALVNIAMIDANIQECESELRRLRVDLCYLGVCEGRLSSNFQPSDALNLTLSVEYPEAVSDWALSSRVNKISGQNFYMVKDVKLCLNISFTMSSEIPVPVSVTFENGTVWPLISAFRGLDGESPDWVKFFEYHNNNPSKTRATVESFYDNQLELCLSAVGRDMEFMNDEEEFVIVTFGH